MIEVKNLVKDYGKHHAVKDISFSVPDGQIVGLLGPNGAGKSTTMNIMTGYISATSGEVKIGGYDILEQPLQAKKLIGYLPEIPPLYEDMTVEEYLNFICDLKGIRKKTEKESSINEVTEAVKISDMKKRLIKNLSKGYKQRVGLAQALIGNPPLLILDEPTVGLDPNQIIEIRSLIKSLGEKHTIILSSHILSEISEVCEYIFIISRGQLAAEGTDTQLVEQMAGENNLELEIKGDKDNVKEMIESLEDVFEYEFAESETENIVRLKIKSDRDVDLREKIFYICAENDLPIMEMSFKQKTLEDIFIELTKDYAAPEKKIRFKKKKDKQEEEDNVSDL